MLRTPPKSNNLLRAYMFALVCAVPSMSQGQEISSYRIYNEGIDVEASLYFNEIEDGLPNEFGVRLARLNLKNALEVLVPTDLSLVLAVQVLDESKRLVASSAVSSFNHASAPEFEEHNLSLDEGLDIAFRLDEIIDLEDIQASDASSVYLGFRFNLISISPENNLPKMRIFDFETQTSLCQISAEE
ncbi:MAG: hypothetical protein WDZ76_07265 [Pseudohongiellaceae bacterium]